MSADKQNFLRIKMQQPEPISTLAGDIAAVLMDGGFSPLPEGQMQGLVCKADGLGWWMGGVFSDGRAHSAHSAISANTPNNPIDFAHYLVAHARRIANPLASNATFDAPELALETERGEGWGGIEAANEAHSEASAPVSSGDILLDGSSDVEPDSPELAADQDHVASGGEPSAQQVEGVINAGADGRDEYGNRPDDPPQDADYSEVELDAIDAASAPELEAPPESEPAPPEETPPGVAIFGDNIHTIRLAKMGRLSQVARELKAALQEGWTVDEFASVQGHVVGNTDDIGAFIGDQNIYARFVEISEQVRRQHAVDAYREQREAELDAADREGVENFDPEEGWP